ncbi:MAG: hypothetical protein ACRCYU_12760 [Nocardioides sp.]
MTTDAAGPVTSQHEQNMRVLEYIYDGEVTGGADLPGLWDLVGEEQAQVSASSLEGRGLIRRGRRLAGEYHITGSGREEIEAMRTRRADRSYRRRECRKQVLRYLDGLGSTGTIVQLSGFEESLDGVQFANEDLQAALGFLIDRGLIAESQRLANGDHYLVRIGPDVSECVDSRLDIDDFLSQKRGSSRSTTTNIHVAGSGHNLAMAVGDHASAEASVTTFNHEHALLFARAIRAAADDLHLGAEQEVNLANIEQTTDPTQAQRATQALYDFLMGSATGTLGQVLGMLAAYGIGIGIGIGIG